MKDHIKHIINLSKRPDGVSRDDVEPGSKLIYYMAEYKHIFTAKGAFGSTKKRYFDTQKRADDYYAALKAPKPAAQKNALAPSVHIAKAVPGGPARLPGEAHYPTNPDGSPAYKITIAPAPPSVLYRTGTHNYH